MEGPRELCERIEGDIDKIMGMYDLAEKVYPYENVHGESTTLENKQRQQNVRYNSESPEAVLKAGSPLSLAFVYMMSRPGAKGPLCFSQVFKNPTRALGWFLLGNSIVMFWKMQYVSQTRQNDQQKSYLNMRVAQNEQSHAILKTLKFHMNTRKMDVFEVDPR